MWSHEAFLNTFVLVEVLKIIRYEFWRISKKIFKKILIMNVLRISFFWNKICCKKLQILTNVNVIFTAMLLI
jgi:hypothetical protein